MLGHALVATHGWQAGFGLVVENIRRGAAAWPAKNRLRCPFGRRGPKGNLVQSHAVSAAPGYGSLLDIECRKA